MAPSDANGDIAMAGLDEIKAPAGVVLPPKEIKAILEKTAGYVARNGIVFEDRIREKEKHNPKFSFLSTNDAYSAYYLWRLSEIKEGRGTAVAAGRVGQVDAEEEKPKGPPEPPEFHFSARMPNISAQDLEVVRLTALFVANNGRQFMTALSQRETGNYQFDFLRPNHSLHNFFQRSIDQYTTLLHAGDLDGEGGKAQQERKRELRADVDDKFRVLGRAKARAEWFKFQDAQKQKKDEEVEKEKLSYAQIDWHGFTVVETVLFTEADEQTNLPPPTSLSELQFASLDQKAMMSIASHNMRIEEAMPEDTDSYGSYPQQPQQMAPPPILTPQAAYQPQREDHRRNEEEDKDEERARERAEGRRRAQATATGGAALMKIKDNYVPRAAARAANRQNMVLCPNCKTQMPASELEEHMRIELLDPRWKEQKAKSDSRHATTNLSTQEVANNLKRLASQRLDLFDGVTGQPISEEELARRKKAFTGYDGMPVEKGDPRLDLMQNVNVEEQIRAIHQKFGDQ
ncbi:Pre-mRNA splicing factor PRP21 like protein-domain-containing protein [Amylocarpus encephaloides]|uniref:Pre-mRNA splicing factor PRP21 like protein-domain-containing protein n=1 Tax=Amylocarpus encephaloides TaxID=45428 RepID=A0A9P7YDS7_9HELO|nr:Pre-mRNA splicing factor PRP21 like protein-domain-containing protein [Amylocarpus encephaloides]